jgi:hypothetical protein
MNEKLIMRKFLIQAVSIDYTFNHAQYLLNLYDVFDDYISYKMNDTWCFSIDKINKIHQNVWIKYYDIVNNKMNKELTNRQVKILFHHYRECHTQNICILFRLNLEPNYEL